MMQHDDLRKERDNVPSEEIQALLPWYATGTLDKRDRRRVDKALQQDPALARQLDLVREELAETIHLNETLPVPSSRVANRLIAAIEAEVPASSKRRFGAAVWLGEFFAGLSPRAVAVTASFATLVIALQGAVLVDIFTKPGAVPPQGAPQAPVYRGLGAPSGSFAMVRFARQASAGEITNFLQNYQAAVVDGPTAGGLYRVRVAMTSLPRGEVARLVARMREERGIEYAAADE